MEFKRCINCGDEKSYDEFYKKINTCKSCRIIQVTIQRNKKLDRPRRKYNSKHSKRQEWIEDIQSDNEFRQEVLQQLFPTGIAPNWLFKKDGR